MFGTRLGAALALLTSALAGCVEATFVPIDARGYGQRPFTRPDVYLDRLPKYPFDPIGIIEVRFPAATDEGTVLDEARRQASASGCDVLVDRSLYQASYGIAGSRALVAQMMPFSPGIQPMPIYTPPPVRPVPAPAPVFVPPPRRREFVCGVRSRVAPASPPSGSPAPVPAVEPDVAAVPPPPAARASDEGSPDKRPGFLLAGALVRTAPSSAAPVSVHVRSETQVTVGEISRAGWRFVTLPDGRVGHVREDDIYAAAAP